MSRSLDKLLDLLKPDYQWASVPSSYEFEGKIRYSIEQYKDQHCLQIAIMKGEQRMALTIYNIVALDSYIADLITWRDKLAKLEDREYHVHHNQP